MRIPLLRRRRRLLAAAVATVIVPAAAQTGAPLVEAAGRGDVAQVQALLRAGADIEQRDANRRTAILAATDGNHVDVVRALIAERANVNAQDNRRDSAFLLAGARGFTEIVRATLAAGADLKSTNRYGGTALIPACHYGHVDTVRVLLGTAIDVNHVNDLGWTALLEAVILGDGGPAHTEIVRLLVAHKADVTLADRMASHRLRMRAVADSGQWRASSLRRACADDTTILSARLQHERLSSQDTQTLRGRMKLEAHGRVNVWICSMYALLSPSHAKGT
jgi:ankyrin repeat protein